MTRQQIGLARRTPLLASLPGHVCDRLLSSARVRRCPRGMAIFMQGDRARHLQIVIKGWVKLYRVTEGGDEALIDLVGAGQSIADLPALRRAPYGVSCESHSDSLIVLLDPRTADACAEARALLTEAVLRQSAAHMDRMTQQLEQLKVMSTSQRLATFLLDTGRALGWPPEFSLPYEKTLLVAHLGMKPESLSRAFGKLRALGVTVTRDWVRIASREALLDHSRNTGAAALAIAA